MFRFVRVLAPVAVVSTGWLGCAPASAAQVEAPPLAAYAVTAVATAACVPGGPTAQDAALADRVRAQLNGPRMGDSVSGYRVSCARAIVQVTRSRGLSERAAVIAVTTAITETGLRNLTEAVDHDSLGLFQQRPSQGWGSPAQLVDPVYATNAFLSAMLRKYPNNSWATGDIGSICQGVQVSALPDAYGREAHDAQILVAALWPPDLGVLDFYLSDSVASRVATRSVVHFGQSPMVPIVGDWDGDGVETVSTFDPTSATFFLSNHPATGQAEYVVRYGNANQAVPVVGDWDGDGRDNIGVRMGLTFYLRTTSVTDPSEVTRTVAFGNAADVPLAGDWDGDGRDNVGVYRPGTNLFYLRFGANTSTTAATRTVAYGNAGGYPLVGDWDGDHKDNIGVRMGATFFFRTSAVDSAAETTTSVAYGNGNNQEYPVVGDWDGNGKATQGIVY